MKKTLVALAALATVGAAFAQSTVTLYGRVDWAIISQTQKTGGVKTAAGNVGLQVNMNGIGQSGTRWGMRGSEDLGGGLKAIFQLESGFGIDDGFSIQGGRLFGRQAYTGLQGNWGTFAVGRQYTAVDNAWAGYFDAQGGSNTSVVSYAWNRGIHADVARVDNAIDYKTPNMGGFMGQLQFAPSENKNPVTGQGAGNYISGLVGYVNGPLTAHLVYDKTRMTAPAGVSTSVRDWSIGASYDLKVVKLFGAYQRADNTANMQDKGWLLGANIPVGSMSLVLNYARETQDANTAVDGKSSAFAGTLTYPLSKRTSVNAHFRSGKNRLPGAVMLATTKNELFGVGFRHDF